jgi:hypothetical protein
VRRNRVAFLGLIALSGACGRDERSEPQRVVFDDVGDTTTYIDSATGVRLTSPEARPQEFTVVELPSGFPGQGVQILLLGHQPLFHRAAASQERLAYLAVGGGCRGRISILERNHPSPV